MAKNKRRRVTADVAARNRSNRNVHCLRVPEGVQSFKLEKECIKRLDFVSYVVGEGNPNARPDDEAIERTYYRHNAVGASGKHVVCLNRTCGKPCPICEYRESLERQVSNDSETQQLIKSLYPKERQLYMLFDRTGEDPNQLLIWDVSYFSFGKLLESAISMGDENERREAFGFPDVGQTLACKIDKIPIGTRASYFAPSSIEFKSRDPLSIDIEKLPCLDELIEIPTYEQVQSLLGVDAVKDEPVSVAVKADVPPWEATEDKQTKTVSDVSSVSVNDDDDDDEDW